MFAARVRPDLELRLFEERHAPAVFAAVEEDRAYLREWLAWVDATRSEEDIRTFIRAARERFAANGEIAAGIWFQEHFVGSVGTHNLNQASKCVEAGYWVSRAYQGRGLVTDCCRAVIRYSMVDLDLNRVELRVATGNTKSRAIAQRLGFTLEGALRDGQLLNGRYVDLEIWSLLRREWRE